MEKILDGFLEILKWLFLTNPVAAVMFLVATLSVWALRHVYIQKEKLQADLLAQLGACETKKDEALAALKLRLEERLDSKEKEIVLLTKQVVELSNNTNTVLRGLQEALAHGNPRALLRSIYNGIYMIGTTKYAMTPTDLQMNIPSDQ